MVVEADTLKHSEITVSRVIKQSDRTTYVILDANIVKSYDIYSLLDQIPNIRHDNITGQITVMVGKRWCLLWIMWRYPNRNYWRCRRTR